MGHLLFCGVIVVGWGHCVLGSLEWLGLTINCAPARLCLFTEISIRGVRRFGLERLGLTIDCILQLRPDKLHDIFSTG